VLLEQSDVWLEGRDGPGVGAVHLLIAVGSDLSQLLHYGRQRGHFSEFEVLDVARVEWHANISGLRMHTER